ncbi:response regulator [Pedobacter faecalis]|uniref:response regulator n=1 Tax=Pedobacter faecalis TaxID=3041495 RepID=UPI002550BF69|nr:response regulator transcription factor [Pedobacter sp. ELA7]
MINIILAEDHQIVRAGIKLLLSDDPDLHIVAEARNGQSVLELLGDNTTADVILSDITMPIMDGFEMLQQVKAKYPDVRVVFLSMIDDEKQIAAAIAGGAAGYLFKNADAQELTFAIKFVAGGQRYICSELAFRLLERLPAARRTEDTYDAEEFTDREMEVLKLIADGLTNAEIADKIFLSKRTVEGHRQALLKKTGARNSASLIRAAMQKNMI